MERRNHRSSRLHEALSHFFQSLLVKRQLDAVALTTDDGLLIAGHGAGDHEELGAIGATRQTSAPFGRKSLHVSRFEVNDVTLCLTTLGNPVRDDAAIGTLMRILAV